MKLTLYCDNQNCAEYKKYSEIEWDGVSTAKLFGLKKCPCCNKERVVKESNKKQTKSLVSIASPQIDSMTPAQRKALLKERSNKDFKKNLEAQKREMDKNVIPR